jgi:altronate hydrolase
VIGTECGGSDAYSGITANPVLGRAGDILTAHGASWVLGESPETYGADHLLIARARTPEVATRVSEVMSWWERYTAAHNATIDNNPAPGNKVGGITTVYEKALGAVSKGGSAALEAVLAYAQPVTSPGLSFMDTPGMDDVSVTGLLAGGCSIIAFTTGRGSCLGAPLVPTVKIASTTGLYDRMRGDMDFDAGVLLAGADVEATALALAHMLIEVASGRRTLGELQRLGDHSFAPWDLGPTL